MQTTCDSGSLYSKPAWWYAEPVIPTAKELAAAFPLLGELETGQLELVSDRLSARSYRGGDIILSENAHSETLCLLLRGTVTAWTDIGGSRTDLAEMLPSSIFGEVSLLQPGPVSANVSAQTDCELLVLERSALDDLRQADPRAASAIVRAICAVLARRIREASDHFDELLGIEAEAPRAGFFESLRLLFTGAGA